MYSILLYKYTIYYTNIQNNEKIFGKKSNEELSTRESLILATVFTIANSGLSGVTMAKVASHANYSTGIVNFYFNSKSQLLIETLRYVVGELKHVQQGYLANTKTLRERLKAYIHAQFDDRVFVREKLAVWHAFWSESQAREDYKLICESHDSDEMDLVLHCIEQMLADNGENDIDAEPLALGLIGLIENLWYQFMIKGKNFFDADPAEFCIRYVSNFIPHFRESEVELPKDKFVDLLPPWTYMNDELFELEVEYLFKKNWMLVGHVNDIPNPGDYLTFDGLNEKIFVIRTERGQINAFHNICRHRGSQILSGEGQCSRALVCPFHGWRYNFDGQLKFIPKADGFPNISKPANGLVPVNLETWQGFIFICLDANAKSLASQMKAILPEITQYRLEQVLPYSTVDRYTLPINWKVFHDIDNEGYHVPIGHPSLNQLYGKDYVDSFINNIPLSIGRFNESPGTLWSVKHYRKLMPEFEHLTQQQHQQWTYFGVFPNLIFGLYPDMMEIYMTLPVSTTQTDVISRTYALPDDRPMIKALRYLNRRINGYTDLEDRSYMIRMQEGLSSSAYPSWKLHNHAETGVGAYHQAIQSNLPVTTLANEPSPNRIRVINNKLLNRSTTTVP